MKRVKGIQKRLVSAVALLALVFSLAIPVSAFALTDSGDTYYVYYNSSVTIDEADASESAIISAIDFEGQYRNVASGELYGTIDPQYSGIQTTAGTYTVTITWGDDEGGDIKPMAEGGIHYGTVNLTVNAAPAPAPAPAPTPAPVTDGTVAATTTTTPVVDEMPELVVDTAAPEAVPAVAAQAAAATPVVTSTAAPVAAEPVVVDEMPQLVIDAGAPVLGAAALAALAFALLIIPDLQVMAWYKAKQAAVMANTIAGLK